MHACMCVCVFACVCMCVCVCMLYVTSLPFGMASEDTAGMYMHHQKSEMHLHMECHKKTFKKCVKKHLVVYANIQKCMHQKGTCIRNVYAYGMSKNILKNQRSFQNFYQWQYVCVCVCVERERAREGAR